MYWLWNNYRIIFVGLIICANDKFHYIMIINVHIKIAININISLFIYYINVSTKSFEKSIPTNLYE